jgi:hypothetical protein
MGYESKGKPTKEKRKLFNFLERHEKQKGYVPEKQVLVYAEKTGLKVKRPYQGWIHLENRRGTKLAGMHKNKRKQIDNWSVN